MTSLFNQLFGKRDGATASSDGALVGNSGGEVKIEYTSETITTAVLEQMAATSNPRLKTIMAAAVKHLHAFAREVNLTPSEWIKGIEFVTRVGQMSSPARQEVILLSDTLGLSTLVNTMHDKTAVEEATQTSLLGPFFREDAPAMKAGEQIAKRDASQEIVLYGRVTNKRGEPLAYAQVGVWQTATDGRYDMQVDETTMDCRGVFQTDANGDYLIRAVRPLGYYIPMDGPVGDMIKAQNRHGMRPAHIHFLISAVGYREMVTALYLADDDHLTDDVVFGAHGDLVVAIEENAPACPVPNARSIKFDFALSVESEADRLSGRVGADPSKIAGVQS
ncbi:MAG: dioxygenase [Hyphomicrobiaceae bacterium]|nr:hydroxyquinol 1,2-dioxygenase [Hyphomicrobiaceae bacterium]